jgi:hypothetical protein
MAAKFTSQALPMHFDWYDWSPTLDAADYGVGRPGAGRAWTCAFQNTKTPALTFRAVLDDGSLQLWLEPLLTR